MKHDHHLRVAPAAAEGLDPRIGVVFVRAEARFADCAHVKASLLEREQMKRRISRGNVVQMIDVNPEDLSLAAVNKYLEIKARGTL